MPRNRRRAEDDLAREDYRDPTAGFAGAPPARSALTLQLILASSVCWPAVSALRHPPSPLRIRGLAAVGEAGLRHAAALRQLESGVLADLASIRELEQGIRDWIRDWIAELSQIIAEGAALGPEPPAAGGAVPASSAGVYASATPARLTVKSKTLVPIDLEHVDGIEAAINAASRDITPPDPSMRLVVGENGVVVPMGRDPGGHLARKVAAGMLRELSPSERAAYLAGESGLTWATGRRQANPN
jgi:hypothetical protein